MKVIVSLITAAIVSAASILWSFNAAIASLETWKEGHTILDNERYEVVFGKLEKLESGQNKIVAILLNRKNK